MLQVKNLNKSFGDNKVLDNISFEVNSGEVCVLLGKSGVGKTTILRCINGLEDFDEGEIIVDNCVMKDKSHISKNRDKIGMVFQNFNLFPHMSVLENIISAPINVLKKSKEEATKEAKEILKMVDLEDKINAYPYELSGGQCQRVAIARACALTPKILCFDEPTSALDVDSIEKVSKIIRDLKSKGMAILIITHDIGFANNIKDKIIKIGG
ncbi:amino acid ABC transporter ATP-binding protein [Terrisporobacter mayombei]|uniref:Glutamine transport ATP-binding protein GlnQ n=1 Tax=Terrisporobacter mayombei TaxID=1541 RepID=A0ABY9Q148_9FIRM|nr:amino acid ABC transporter ATP-binding protein [Terrisporobacter mayombei]MCC3867423.1 amino acid ABC transporter ATP-binding protein [Terrisporobacter mayombei]WMT81683.1 Glutamine transport ATP-binding protein GlnQ [Terrisporobacter mayombei]